MAYKLYRTPNGPCVQEGHNWTALPGLGWDDIFMHDDPYGLIEQTLEPLNPSDSDQTLHMLIPAKSQEIWAAGVTYQRSKTARMEESEAAGGGNFYDRVYDAERPELFFKCMPDRAVGFGSAVKLRKDSQWMVPEPELTLAVNWDGKIFGYTVGNDMSCRDIEGENPLYLPQAKTWDGCAAAGPCICVTREALPSETQIRLLIERETETVFEDVTSLDQMKRTPEELVGWLLREMRFKKGFLLMTGTGIIPPDDFSLRVGDIISITIDEIGTLTNLVK